MKRVILVLICLTAMVSADPHPDARPYFREVTPAEWRVIHTVVTTTSDTSVLALWGKADFLEREGNRVDHVHPLRFLLTLFTNEELKVATRNIKNGQPGIVWKKFSSRFGESLDRARALDNLSDEVIEHFAKTLELDLDKVRALINANRWEGLMNLLATEVPRKGDFRRYDL